jgi:ribonucleoside-diphosphate reductase alpha chain
MYVKKRDGSKQDLDLDKIHQVLEWACNGDNDDTLSKIKGVSVSEIEMRAHLHFFPGITTKQIHECLIKAASELISEDYPNYDQVAARLRWFAVRKEAFGTNLPPHLLQILKRNTKLGAYHPEVVSMYSGDEWNTINDMIDHRRDDLFRYAGAEQMAKKYLVQNRKTKKVFETFQIPYILVAAILFHKYPKETRLSYVKRYYDAISQHYISLPTPIMAGLRTKVRQFSSCTVIEVGDSLESIKAGSNAIIDYASRKAGIGLNIGQIRAAGQPVRGGDAVTTGMLPFSKLFAASLKSCSQGAVRGASATFNYPVWHLEFESLIELKNNKGTDETRLRTVDYCVHVNRTMYERFVKNESITLFSPEEVPDLYQAFYGDPDKFKELYEKYEADPSKTKKQLSAREVFTKLMQERFETGRIYIMNADHMNTHSPFYEPVKMTNLCVEIGLPTTPVGYDDSLISLCTLSATNVGKINTFEEMAEACELCVRGLDALLDYQEYPNEAARRSTMLYRPLGVGIIGFAHFLAKNHLTWGSDATLDAVENLIESMAYSLTRASVDLAKESGACPARTKYHDGILPMDTSAIKANPRLDWSGIREDLKKYGIRNATLMAGMPSETSSQLSNETNGFEAPKDLISIKGSKDGVMAQVVPEYGKLAPYYQTAWNIAVPDYLKTVAVIQKYFDQSLSTNTSYNPSKGAITMSTLLQDLLLAYKLGIKTLYYNNTYDGSGDSVSDDDGCASGACKL